MLAIFTENVGAQEKSVRAAEWRRSCLGMGHKTGRRGERELRGERRGKGGRSLKLTAASSFFISTCRPLPLLAVAILAACDSPVEPPIDPDDVYGWHLPGTDLTLRWPTGATIRVFIEPGAPAERAAMLVEAFELDVTQWNAASRGDYHLEPTASLANAHVVLRWSDTPSVLATAPCAIEPQRGVTTFCLGTPPNRLYRYSTTNGAATNVVMIVTIASFLATDFSVLRRTVAHELGHVLGLAQHSPISTDLMYGGDLTTPFLTHRDIATVRTLYDTRADITP